MQESLRKGVQRREREGNKKIHLLRSVEISQVGVQDISPVQELKNKRYSLVKMMRSITMQKREDKSEQSLDRCYNCLEWVWHHEKNEEHLQNEKREKRTEIFK